MYTFAFVLLAVACSLVSGSNKSGFSLHNLQYQCGDTQALYAAGWWYSWSMNINIANNMGCSQAPGGGIDYMSMKWAFKLPFVNVPSNAYALLGFNEPNFADQANMTPQEAATAWPILEAGAAGKLLISPAPARCTPPGIYNLCTMETFQWLDQFLALCTGCRVDRIAVHTFTCNAANDIAFLEKVYDRYKKKVWLTEFACPGTTDEVDITTYMFDMIPYLEMANFVERYAWFSARIPEFGKFGNFVFKVNNLLKDDSANLTAVGEFYMYLTHLYP